MKKSCERYVATHIGPESCGAARKGGVEALTAGRAGRVRAVERYRRRMLSSRSEKGAIWWKYVHPITERTPLLRPKLYLPYVELQAIAAL